MKKYFYFIVIVFIVSTLYVSCKKDDNPVTNSTGTTTTNSWTTAYRSGLNIPINNGYTTDSVSAVIPPDYFPTNYIRNVNLVLDSIIGVDASQLKFELIHQGEVLQVIDTLNNGGPGNSFIHTVLTDSSSDPIRFGTSPFTGLYKPANQFSLFRDLPPEGQYILRIQNLGSIRTGVIKSWGITLTYSPRMSNYCLEFNGTSNYCQVPSSTSLNGILSNGTFTLEGWYKILGYPQYNYFSFLDKQNSWYFEYSRQDTAWTFVNPGFATAKAKIPVVFDTWYHIAMTYDGPASTIKFYSNGQLLATVSASYSFTANTLPLYIARGISGANEFGYGRYDEIRIWNIVRTDTEIANDYNRILTGSENGLVLYFKFGEGGGDIVNDATANGNTGTLFNSPFWSQDGPDLTR